MKKLLFVLIALLALTSTAGAVSVTMNVGDEYRGYVCRDGIEDDVYITVYPQNPGTYRVTLEADGEYVLSGGTYSDSNAIHAEIRAGSTSAVDISHNGNHKSLTVQAANEIGVVVWPNACYAKYQTIPVSVRVENMGVNTTGKLSGSLKYPNGSYVLPDVDAYGQAITPVVAVYDSEGRFIDMQAVANGKYSFTLPFGAYKLHFRFKDYDFWYPYSPASEASLIYLKSSSLTRSVTFASAVPHITGITTGSSGEYVIYGTGFGSVKGYVDFGGYLTNSSTYIMSWSDTEIHVMTPSSAIPTSIRVFGKGAGFSNSW
jgi:hypothetical protein